MRNPRFFIGYTALALGLGLSACTATEQSSERATPGAISSGARRDVAPTAAPAVPAEVNTDADRRAIYNSSGTSSSVPDATPNRVRLGNQAADINRQKRIENVNTDDPNNTSPETRIRRLSYDPPVETPVRKP
ncbi:hypothetical protein I2I05_05590 [Hymenobacter sp. BT683]|uniref:Lipoprotein n=1 Tax=Hymenobacter jeongseonensis TaxID=2791027 RepID=A0ABS0IFB2_9BACT|nr:hypothetical protein [Hymenobacter jeongseonensis]MBF9236862.1 hypothetical protein [Hymenobacter jeongseonensis]